MWLCRCCELGNLLTYPDTLGVENVSKGGHGSLDPSLGDSLGDKFHFTHLSWTMDESFDREFLGTSEESEGCHPFVGSGNGVDLLDYISFRTESYHDVTLVFEFK